MIEPYQMLLIPFTMCIGVFEGFFFGAFAAGWIACLPDWGVGKINLIFMTYGLSHALSSLCIGFLTKYIGRQFLDGINGIALGIATSPLILDSAINIYKDLPHVYFLTAAFNAVFVSNWRLQIYSTLHTYITYT